MTFAVVYLSLGIMLWLFASSNGSPFASAVDDGSLPTWVAIISSLIFILIWPLVLVRAVL
jgi:hypothetical protein